MLCRNNEVWPHTHTHNTVEESRRCWQGQVPVPTAPIAAPPAPQTVVVPPLTIPTRMISARQSDYIRDLGGDMTYAAKLTYDEASEYITRLTGQARTRQRPPQDPRLDILKGMLDLVADGYYATPPAERDKIDFVRISRPTRGRFRGAFKVQTKHAETWKEALVLWPSGSWTVYRRDIIDAVFLVIGDSQGCRIRYSIENQACHHCNTGLTDARSRHYLIGPVCEKKYNLQWAINEVDDKNNGMSFEDLIALGLPTRVWQDRELVA